jgi:hypothetical protein
MIKHNTQSAKKQDKELLTGLGSKVVSSCTSSAVLHEKYGWNVDREVCTSNREPGTIFHGDILKTIIYLNDRG